MKGRERAEVRRKGGEKKEGEGEEARKPRSRGVRAMMRIRKRRGSWRRREGEGWGGKEMLMIVLELIEEA